MIVDINLFSRQLSEARPVCVRMCVSGGGGSVGGGGWGGVGGIQGIDWLVAMDRSSLQKQGRYKIVQLTANANMLMVAMVLCFVEVSLPSRLNHLHQWILGSVTSLITSEFIKNII